MENRPEPDRPEPDRPVEAALERAVALLEVLLEEDGPLAAERRAARGEFFGPGGGPTGTAPEAVLAERRYLEWFLFERESEAAGGRPARALHGAWLDRADPLTRDLEEALLHSRAGVYEVRDVDPGRGLWLHDFLAHGAYPVAETAASHALGEGDVLVGRLFPVGDQQFLLSPAVAVFREPSLLVALERDMEQLRAGRRGTLRIEQRQLEQLFFGGGAPTPAAPSGGGARERLAGLLRAGGAPDDQVAAWLAALENAAADPAAAAPPAEVLEEVAFETGGDLDAARRALLEAWEEARVAASRPAASSAVGEERVRRALEDFDKGRGEGRDLERLFAQLERDLELDGEPEDDAGEAPDFPGVVRALVVEFLWELSESEGREAAARYAGLPRFAEYAEDVSLLEDLTAERLVDYAARVAPDRGEPADADDAVVLLDSLEAFARWCEADHGLPLWSGFERSCGELREALPRVAEANARLRAERREAPTAAGRVRRAADGAFVVERDGGAAPLDLGPLADGELVREGDVARTRAGREGLRLMRLLPPAAAPFELDEAG